MKAAPKRGIFPCQSLAALLLLAFVTADVVGGDCDFRVKNCIPAVDAVVDIWVYNGDDGAHLVATSNYHDLHYESTTQMSCQQDVCDFRFAVIPDGSISALSIWSYDECDNWTVSKPNAYGYTAERGIQTCNP